MEAPLLAIAQADIDIVPLVFDRFFVSFPDERAKFMNLEAAAGRMVNETLEAMIGLAEDAWWVETTVTNFVDLHRDYGAIGVEVYAGFVDALTETLQEAAGDGWSADSAAAWADVAARLKGMIGGALDE